MNSNRDHIKQVLDDVIGKTYADAMIAEQSCLFFEIKLPYFIMYDVHTSIVRT
jgi:hypothetical protein